MTPHRAPPRGFEKTYIIFFYTHFFLLFSQAEVVGPFCCRLKQKLSSLCTCCRTLAKQRAKERAAILLALERSGTKQQFTCPRLKSNLFGFCRHLRSISRFFRALTARRVVSTRTSHASPRSLPETIIRSP